MKSLGVEEEIRERHGVTSLPHESCAVNEASDTVKLVVRDIGGTKAISLTPDEARYIAAKLRRVAWRVEARQ